MGCVSRFMPSAELMPEGLDRHSGPISGFMEPVLLVNTNAPTECE